MVLPVLFYKNHKVGGFYFFTFLVKAIVDGLNEEIYDKDVCKVSLKFRPHYPDGLRLLPESNIKTIKESLYTLESEKMIKESTENKSNNSFWKNLFSNLFK